MEYGLRALVLFLVAVKGTDVGAYFVGSAIGRHKLVPWLSPSKTWEGLLGGLAFGVGCSVGFVALFAPVFSADTTDDITLLEAAVFGLVLGAFGQGADLCESAIKRDAGLKDAGRTVPGFGGVLDVIDSCLLSSPVAYVLLGMFR
jgi:phosphatidate cytidylyltransferase